MFPPVWANFRRTEAGFPEPPAGLARGVVVYQNMIGNREAQAFDAGPNADHRAVYLYSLVNLKPWFDGLR